MGVRHIGKESNRLDEVEDGLVADAGEVYVEYRDDRGEERAQLLAQRIPGFQSSDADEIDAVCSALVAAMRLSRAPRRISGDDGDVWLAS
jgi:hypothetical protein